MKEAMEQAGIALTCIGQVEEEEAGIRFEDGREIEPPASDEIYKAVD